jgi:hypothetical protein
MFKTSVAVDAAGKPDGTRALICSNPATSPGAAPA